MKGRRVGNIAHAPAGEAVGFRETEYVDNSCVCMCVCMREKKREKERRKRGKEERKRECVYLCVPARP